MPIQFIQYDDYLSTTSAITVTNDTPLNTTTGNCLIVVVNCYGVGDIVSSITDTAGNTYVKAEGQNTATNERSEIWYALNITGNAANITLVTYNGTTSYRYISVAEFSGIVTASALDDTSYNTNSTTSHTSGTMTASVNNAVIIGCLNGVGTEDYTVGTSFTTFSSDITLVYNFAEYRIISSAEDYSATCTSGTTNSTIMIGAIFKGIAETNFTETVTETFGIADSSSKLSIISRALIDSLSIEEISPEKTIGYTAHAWGYSRQANNKTATYFVLPVSGEVTKMNTVGYRTFGSPNAPICMAIYEYTPGSAFLGSTTVTEITSTTSTIYTTHFNTPLALSPGSYAFVVKPGSWCVLRGTTGGAVVDRTASDTDVDFQTWKTSWTNGSNSFTSDILFTIYANYNEITTMDGPSFHLGKNINENINYTESMSKITTHIINEILGELDNIIFDISTGEIKLNISDSFRITDNITKTAIYERVLSDYINYQDTYGKEFKLSQQDLLGISEIISKAVKKYISIIDSLGLSDVVIYSEVVPVVLLHLFNLKYGNKSPTFKSSNNNFAIKNVNKNITINSPNMRYIIKNVNDNIIIKEEL